MVIGVGAQLTLGGTTFLPEKKCMKKKTKCPNFTRFLLEKLSEYPNFYDICPKINKFPEFYMTLPEKCQNFS